MEDKYGKICYDGYIRSCGGKTWDGKEMMKWEDMPNDKQNHWIIGANNVVDKVLNPHLQEYDEALKYIDNNML